MRLIRTNIIFAVFTCYMGGQQVNNMNERSMSLRTTIAVGLLFVSFIVTFSWLMTSSYISQLQRTPPLPRGQYRQRDVYDTSSTSSLPCDEECVRFGRLLTVWPANKPKAAVILLVKSPNRKIEQSLQQFDANVNDAYNYPVIVFHEENMNSEADRQRMRSFSNSSLYFQVYNRLLSYWKQCCLIPSTGACCCSVTATIDICSKEFAVILEDMPWPRGASRLNFVALSLGPMA